MSSPEPRVYMRYFEMTETQKETTTKKTAPLGVKCTDLLCCPCCASTRVKTIKGSIGNRKIWRVFCVACQVRTGPEYTLRKAKEVWNRRAALRFSSLAAEFEIKEMKHATK